MSNARFSILQSRAVRDDRISDSQFRTLAALGMYADKDGWCFPKLDTLGKDLGKSKQAVGRDTIALRKLGYLEVISRHDPKTGNRQSNQYRLVFDFDQVNATLTGKSTNPPKHQSTSEVDGINEEDNAPRKNVKALRANQIPEVVLYREVTDLYPPKEVFTLVVESVQKVKARLGREVTKDDLKPFRLAWVTKGYNRFAITWLQWAETGQIPQNGSFKPKEQVNAGISSFLERHGNPS